MSLSRRTSRSLKLAVLLTVWAVFCLQPAAANPTPPPRGSGVDRNTTVRAERQQSLDAEHGIREYQAGDAERRINLRLAVRVRPYNGYTYVKASMAVTCATLTGSGWRRHACSLGNGSLGIQRGDEELLKGMVRVGTINSGADGYYEAYGRWFRTSCQVSGYRAAMFGDNAIGAAVGLQDTFFNIPGGTTYPASDSYTLCCG